MRWPIVIMLGAALGCTKDKPVTMDSGAAAVSSTDLSPNASMAVITVNAKPFAVASVNAFQTNRAGEKDPEKAAILLATIEDPLGNTITFDIPWNKGVARDIAGVRVTCVTRSGTYSTETDAHANVTRVDTDDAGYLYDANFEIAVTNAAKGETLTIRGQFDRLRVKPALQHLQRL